MDIQAAFPGKYIKAADLAGKPKIVTIANVSMQKVGDDNKPVMQFLDCDQNMVLNLTNSNTTADILGSSDTDKWSDKRIELYATKVQFGAKMVDAIRVRMVGLAGDEVDETNPF